MAGGSCSQIGTIGSFLGGDLLKLLFTPDFIQHHQAELDLFFQVTNPYHSTGGALMRQINAMGNHDTCNVLGKITAPTLVITGDSDRVIPPENSDILTQKIPGSQKKIIKNAAHAFSFSHPKSTATAILNFLEN